MKELLQLPWSNQPVRPFVRWLAWVFVACDGVAISLVGYFSVREGIAAQDVTFVLGTLALMLFFLLLFGRVALTGTAPVGWVPWK
jgi:hypothetical protein